MIFFAATLICGLIVFISFNAYKHTSQISYKISLIICNLFAVVVLFVFLKDIPSYAKNSGVIETNINVDYSGIVGRRVLFPIIVIDDNNGNKYWGLGVLSEDCSGQLVKIKYLPTTKYILEIQIKSPDLSNTITGSVDNFIAQFYTPYRTIYSDLDFWIITVIICLVTFTISLFVFDYNTFKLKK